MIDFNIPVGTGVAHAFPERDMFDIIKVRNTFYFAIGDANGVIKHPAVEFGYGKVCGFINGASKDGASVLFKMFGVIGTSPEKTDA